MCCVLKEKWSLIQETSRKKCPLFTKTSKGHDARGESKVNRYIKPDKYKVVIIQFWLKIIKALNMATRVVLEQ